jgi:hypothetical protein
MILHKEMYFVQRLLTLYLRTTYQLLFKNKDRDTQMEILQHRKLVLQTTLDLKEIVAVQTSIRAVEYTILEVIMDFVKRRGML